MRWGVAQPDARPDESGARRGREPKYPDERNERTAVWSPDDLGHPARSPYRRNPSVSLDGDVVTTVEWIQASLVGAQVLGQTYGLIRYRMRLKFLKDIYLAQSDSQALRIAGATTRPAIGAAVERFAERRRATECPRSLPAGDLSGSEAHVAEALDRVLPRQAVESPVDGVAAERRS